MIGRLLCRFGFHRWDYRTTFVHGVSYEECSRCMDGRRAVVR